MKKKSNTKLKKIIIQQGVGRHPSQSFFTKYPSVIVIAIICIYSLLIWWPTRNLPYHWDSAGFVVNAARQLLQTNFNPLIAGYSDFAHPPFFIALLALTWKILGQNILVSHLLNLPLLPIYLASSYFIAKKLTNTYNAILSTIVIAFIPSALAEYGMIYIDLPMAATATAGIAALLYKKNILATILLSIAVIIKIPPVILLPPLALYLYKTSKDNRSIKTYIPLIVPIFVFLFWVNYHFMITGWSFIRPGRPSKVATTLPTFISSLIYFVKLSFIAQSRWLMTIASLLSVGYLYVKNKKLLQDQLNLNLLPLLIMVSALAFFTFTNEYFMRYGLFFYPFLIITSISLVTSIIKNKIITVSFILITISITTAEYYLQKPTQVYDVHPNEDQTYKDMISIGQQAASFLETNYPDVEIYGDWPENYQLLQPFQGYVSKPLNFKNCEQFIYKPDITQIVYAHPYSVGQMLCRELVVEYFQAKELKHIQSHSKILKLILIEASNSAKPLPNPSQ